MAKVLIAHTVTGHTAEVDEVAVPIHAANGWVLCDDEGQPIPDWEPPTEARVNPDDDEPADQELVEITEPAPPFTDHTDDEAPDEDLDDATDVPQED